MVLTRRSFAMRAHRGEIAFPGGRSHDDETPTETALREAHEEIGLDSLSGDAIRVAEPDRDVRLGFGHLSHRRDFLGDRPTFVIEPSEVDRAFSVALSDLVAEGAFLEERWRRPVPRPGADADGFFPL